MKLNETVKSENRPLYDPFIPLLYCSSSTSTSGNRSGSLRLIELFMINIVKDKSIIVIVLSCLLFNALFIVLASYQLITGEQESIRVNVDEMKDGLLNQEKTA